MNPHKTRHSHYHGISPVDNDGEIQMQRIAATTSRRSPSLDSLCEYDDGTFSLRIDRQLSSSLSNSRDQQPNRFPSYNVSTPALQNRKSPSNTWKAGHLKDGWLWDMSCIIFSAACIVSVVVLVFKLDGTWVSKWTFVLQPSTLIAILITAAQSSMMLVVSDIIGQLKWLHMSLPRAHPLADLDTFESASKGPLGSLGLFYRWRTPTITIGPLVYTGSLITVVALAMGPFAQQVINIQTNNLVAQGNANSTILVSNYYNSNNSIIDTEMSLAMNGQIVVSRSANGAFDVARDIQGAFFDGIYGLGGSFIDFGCPTGNCSWSPFSSLGMCSTCHDVTSNTKITSDGVAGGTRWFQTPGGWYIEINQFDQVAARANASGETLGDLSGHLVSLVVVQSPYRIQSVTSKYIITECEITWCEKHYSNITVTNGNLQDQYSIKELPLWAVKNQDFGGLARGQSTKDNWIFLLTTDSNGGNISSALSPFPRSAFNVTIYDHLAISEYFTSQFNITSESGTGYFASGENISSTMENITASMTNRIAKSAGNPSAQGIIWQLQPVIRMHFAWLALPLALILFTAILLIATMLMTRYFHAPTWKSSPLPFFYHGIRKWDAEVERDIMEGRLEKVHVMEDRASLMRVRIVTSPDGGTWLAQ